MRRSREKIGDDLAKLETEILVEMRKQMRREMELRFAAIRANP